MPGLGLDEPVGGGGYAGGLPQLLSFLEGRRRMNERIGLGLLGT